MVKAYIQETDHAWDNTEDQHVISFVEFYAKRMNNHERYVAVEPRHISGSQKSFDYAVPALRLAIEVKGIYREEDEKASCRSSMTEISKALNDYPKGIPGTYSVVVPHNLKLNIRSKKGRKNLEELKNKLHSAIESGTNKIIYDPYGKFEISKVRNEGNRIQVFRKPRSYGGPFGVLTDNSVREVTKENSPQSFDAEMMRNIKKAESQLSLAHMTEFRKRICLLVSRDIICEVPRGHIHVLASHYKKILNLHNIDEIWLISNYPEHRIDLLYEHSFMSSFHSHTLIASEQNIKLFELWFPALMEAGRKHDHSLIAALKRLIRNRPAHLVFPDISTRYKCVYFAQHLANEKFIDDAIWLTKRLINDPDPPEPGDETCEEDIELHNMVAAGELPEMVDMILTRLAWVLQEIALSKNHLTDALNLTAKLTKHDNLLVKLHALMPLGIISQRINELTGFGEKPHCGQYGKFRRIIQEYKKLVKNNPNCKAISNDLYELVPDADNI